MSGAFSSIGTELAVSAAAPATYNAAGFSALTWTPIADISDIGEYGQESGLVTFTPIDTGIVAKRKGSRNYGALSLTTARVPDDAGQAILVAAEADNASYSFRVTLQDGTVQYFSAQVMSYKTNVGNADAITTATIQVEIDNAIVEVAA